jgi:hypothetical protein
MTTNLPSYKCTQAIPNPRLRKALPDRIRRTVEKVGAKTTG